MCLGENGPTAISCRCKTNHYSTMRQRRVLTPVPSSAASILEDSTLSSPHLPTLNEEACGKQFYTTVMLENKPSAGYESVEIIDLSGGTGGRAGGQLLTTQRDATVLPQLGQLSDSGVTKERIPPPLRQMKRAVSFPVHGTSRPFRERQTLTPISTSTLPRLEPAGGLKRTSLDESGATRNLALKRQIEKSNREYDSVLSKASLLQQWIESQNAWKKLYIERH